MSSHLDFAWVASIYILTKRREEKKKISCIFDCRQKKSLSVNLQKTPNRRREKMFNLNSSINNKYFDDIIIKDVMSKTPIER